MAKARRRNNRDVKRRVARLPEWGEAVLRVIKAAPHTGLIYIIRTLEFLLAIAKERLEDGSQSHEGEDAYEDGCQGETPGQKRGRESDCEDAEGCDKGWGDYWT